MNKEKDEKSWLLWIDFLGFKDWMLKQDNLEQALDELDMAIDFCFNLEKVKPFSDNFKCHLISDTLVIGSKNGGMPELCALSAITSTLMTKVLPLGLTLRGVIVYEEYTSKVSIKRTILAGKAIARAATIEPLVDFYGCILDETCINFFDEMINDFNEEYTLGKCGDLKFKFSEYFTFKEVATKSGAHNTFVANWLWPEIPALLLKYHNNMVDRVKRKDIDIYALKSHTVKLKNSIDMQDTVCFYEEDSDIVTLIDDVKQEWSNLNGKLESELKLIEEAMKNLGVTAT